MSPIPNIITSSPGSYPDAQKYMENWDWVLAMARGNFLGGPGFEGWNGGTSFTNPANGAALADGWTLEKGGTAAATADIAREGTTKDSGSYSKKVAISGAGSSNSYLRVKQSVVNPARFAGQSVVFSARVKVSTVNKVRLSVYDGTTTAYSEYHSGGGAWEKLTVALACSASVSELTVKIEITSDFTGDTFIDSSFLYAIEATASTEARAALEYFGPADPLGLLLGALTMNGTLSMNGVINESKGADIASASTIDLDAATGNLLDVTGTTTITAITLSVGRERVVRFTGALTLTHGASLVLPGAASITTAAGDFAIFRGYASGVVRCVLYQKAAAVPGVAAATQAEQETGSATTAFVSPGRQHFHQSAAKAWVRFNGTGTPAITVSYNVSSITDNGAGDFTINFTTAFSSANYAGVLATDSDLTTAMEVYGENAPTASAFRFRTVGVGAGPADRTRNYAVFYGDQ